MMWELVKGGRQAEVVGCYAGGLGSLRALIDSDALIDFLQGIEAARTEIGRYDPALYSVISWMEVMCGAERQLGPPTDFLIRETDSNQLRSGGNLNKFLGHCLVSGVARVLWLPARRTTRNPNSSRLVELKTPLSTLSTVLLSQAYDSPLMILLHHMREISAPNAQRSPLVHAKLTKTRKPMKNLEA